MSSAGFGTVPAFSIESNAATMRRACAIESRSAAPLSATRGAARPLKFQLTRWRPAAPGPVSVCSVSPFASWITIRDGLPGLVRRYQMSAPYCGLAAWKT